MIERIVRDCEERFSPESHWPVHSLDVEDDKREPLFDLYCGAGGVVWALHYLEAAGAVELRRAYRDYIATAGPQPGMAEVGGLRRHGSGLVDGG